MKVVCPSCHVSNNIPFDRIGDKPNCGKCKQPLFLGKSVSLDHASFAKHISQSDLPVVIDFWAAWCGPCKMMAPVFESVASELEPRFQFAKVDTEKYQAIAAQHRIQSIPTLAIFKGGREIARQSGALPAGQLKKWLNSVTV